jgi:hypothetical protein
MAGRCCECVLPSTTEDVIVACQRSDQATNVVVFERYKCEFQEDFKVIK